MISRIVNCEYRICGDAERTEYLRRLGIALSKCDWTLLAFAVMSTHVHLAAVAGLTPSSRLIQGLHSGFAQWLNPRQGRLGHVFADRHRTIWIDRGDCLKLLAYLHNNPVRAGLVTDAVDSSWSSHRMYVGRELAPGWLRIDMGLEWCGLAATASGRWRFDVAVSERSGEGRQPELCGDDLAQARTAARTMTAGPVEVGSPLARGQGCVFPIVARPGTSLRARPLDAHDVLGRVVGVCALQMSELLSRRRTRSVSDARRVALLAWATLGGRNSEMARALGITSAAATQLLSRDPARLRRLAVLADQVLAESGTS